MSENRRGSYRNQQNRDNRPQGGSREPDDRNASYALQITRCIHDPYGSTLVVEAQAVRGKKPARNMLVELLVNDEVVRHDTTTWSGIVKFLVREVKLPIGKYSATVRAVGIVGNENELIIQATEQFDVRPASVVPLHATHASVQCEVVTQEDGFAVTCIVTTSCDEIPMPNMEVDLVGFSDEDYSLQTDRFGTAKTVFHIPYLEDGSTKLVPYRALVLSSGTMLSDVLTLTPPPEPIPHFVDFGDPAEQPGELGTYHVRIKAEDKEGQPVKGVRFTLTAGGAALPVIKTNRYGEAVLTLTCNPEKDMTRFVVDIPGIEKSKQYDLMSAYGRDIRIRKTETKLALVATLWGHAKQAFRRGSGDIRYVPTVPAESETPSASTADDTIIDIEAEVIPHHMHTVHQGASLHNAPAKNAFGPLLALIAGVFLVVLLGFLVFELFTFEEFVQIGGCIAGGMLLVWLLFRNQAAACRSVYRNRKPIFVYGFTRPFFGFLGFCCGTNNRRSNILLYLIVPAAYTYLVWIVVLAVQAYIQHPLSERLPNVVSGTETTLVAFREVPMSIGTFLMRLGGVILLTLFAIPYWIAARREEVKRSYLYIKHRLQTDSGSVVEQQEPGLVKQWFTTMLVKKQLHPAQQVASTVGAPGVAPAKAAGMSGHTLALTLLTVAEVCDWIFTAFGKFFGGKKGE